MKNKASKGLLAFIGILTFIIGAIASFAVMTIVKLPKTETLIQSETIYYSKYGQESHSDVNLSDAALSFHFLELGNKYTGDCTYVKTDTCDILIDCGSRAPSVPYVKSYLDRYVEDGTLEYVIITHAHQDHYAGFATSKNVNSIFDLYKCEKIITFSKTNQKSTSATYNNFLRELNDEVSNGATHLTADNCAGQSYSVGTNVTMTVLDSYYYTHESSSENDYSVCTLFSYEYGSGNFRHALFTGDLEADGEARLATLNTLPQVDLYKAGHHGSKTSSTDALLSVIRPRTVCVCCCAGSPEYTKTAVNQFPTQIFINNVAKYTSDVYVTTLCVNYEQDEFTSFNGNVVYLISDAGKTNVICSNDDAVLKDSDWFKANRTWPS